MKNEYEQAAEILEKAADGFESGRYGWTQGMARLRKSSQEVVAYCSIGAMYYEAGLYKEGHGLPQRMLPAFNQAEAQLSEVVGADQQYITLRDSRIMNMSSIPQWNDLPGRTKEEVIDKMKEAAKELRNKA